MAYIKLEGQRHFNEILLGNLGKINVLSGKNNSGKTQVMQEISKNKNVTIGIKITDKIRESLNNELLTSLTLECSKLSNSSFRTSCVNSILSKEMLFLNLFDQFHSSVHESFLQRHGTFRVNTSQKLQSWYDSCFPTGLLKRTYIPPQRNILTSERVQNSSSILENGQNLINCLFYLNNDVPGSSNKKIFDQLSQLFEEVTEGMKFHISINGESNLDIHFLNNSAEYIHADQSGLGLREVLYIIYQILLNNNGLILLDEFESHLHPSLQKRMLKCIESNFNGSMIISTHSNIALNSVHVSKYFKTDIQDKKILVKDVTSIAELLLDVGYSVTDNLVSDLVLLVEGHYDIGVYNEVMKKFGIIPKYNVKSWFLGGNAMEKQDLSVIKQFNNVYAIIDNDPQSNPSREEFIKNCDSLSIPYTRLKRYSIENYFMLDVIKDNGGQAPEHMNEIDENKSIEKQGVKFSKKMLKKWAEKSDKKHWDNTDLETAMLKIVDILEKRQ